MTIGVISQRARANVLWVGQPISGETRSLLERLQFSVDDLSPTSVLLDDGYLGGLAAVIFVQTEAKPLTIVTELESHVARLLDHDCLLIVLAAAAGLSSIKNTLTKLKIPSIWPTSGNDFEVFTGYRLHNYSDFGEPYFPHVRVYRGAPPVEVIQQLLLVHGPQHTPASNVPTLFKITGPAEPNVNPNHRLMLRRSFHDCAELHLTQIDDGRSPVRVYLAHAILSQATMARRPLPFFVKVGPRRKIILEWRNYEQRVRQYVPFHLAPRLVTERCALGAHTGIIVGDFVEDSESLGQCSRSGRAMTPVGTLFDRTLRGWHFQARTENRSLHTAMMHLVKGPVPMARLNIANDLGATRTPAELKAQLMQRVPEPLLWGPIHGDLHANNVRVRGNDAILIDFLSSRLGPLLTDPAALEVGIIVRVPTNEKFDSVAWTRIVRELFSKDALQGLPTASDPREPYAWIASCVRQIRLHALPMQRSQDQYAIVLAYHLLQAAIKDRKALPDENLRRATAYCLTEILLA